MGATIKILIFAVVAGIITNWIYDKAQENRAWYAAHPCIQSHTEHFHADPTTVFLPMAQPDGSIFIVPQYYAGYDYDADVCDARASAEPRVPNTADGSTEAAISGAIASTPTGGSP